MTDTTTDIPDVEAVLRAGQTLGAATAEIHELVRKAERLHAAVTSPAPLAQIRDALNAVGITRARQALRDAPDVVANARLSHRAAQQAEKALRDAHGEALRDAKGDLGYVCFDVRANKTWLVQRPDGTPIPEGEQRSMVADEKTQWIADQANRRPDVQRLTADLARAEEATQRASDDLALAQDRLSIAKRDLEAAAAELRALTLALPRED